MEPTTLAERVDAWALERPSEIAFARTRDDAGDGLSWRGYAERSTALARHLVALGLEPGERVAVLLPDGPEVHTAFLANERAGLVTVGIGPRAGRAELDHLLAKTGARALVSSAQHREHDLRSLVEAQRRAGAALEFHVDPRDFQSADASQPAPLPGCAADALWLLNSTSGTTGLPKCVTHTQARWFYFHELALASGELSNDDVFLSAIPAPFGFGLWTAHFTPTLLGSACILSENFDADETLRAIERHGVTVLACVSTQFIMMLGSKELERCDLSTLRVMYTGGEAVPYERAAAFEDRSGARVLQFYGSNETGALSGTTLRDSRDQRLRTAGRPIEGMRVRLVDEAGNDVSERGRGEPACRGPATSDGYYDDPEANAKLVTPDGWMRTGDIGEFDADGYLRIVGRTADFIIRGGKNISGPVVEEAVSSHPAVAHCAAIAWPDPTFGERVCAYVELRSEAALTLESLREHLEAGGIGKELWPEHLVVLDALPRASGGKIAKGELRADARERARGTHRSG